MKVFVSFAAWLSFAAAGAALAGNYSFLDEAPAKHFTDQDIQLLTDAVNDALENSADGNITAWRNPETDASGKLKPLETYQSEGITCRRLQIANKAGGLKNNVAFNFCRQTDNTWKLID
ncbi:MAG: RT0821/Lpp0805 family surface protein [Gammaproteobacteria bacterium]|nr:RT0821/Lpp0805 family surface protein [Gammaproteobacteria bacterium]